MVALQKHPVFYSLLENEIKILQLISHPNVLKVEEIFGTKD